MDRDMVNCLHYLYQWGQITNEQFADPVTNTPIFWCKNDTRVPLYGRKVIDIEPQTGEITLPEGVYDLLDSIENQLRSLPKPDFLFGYPISAAIRGKGQPRPAFLAISYDPTFAPIKQVVLDAARNTGFDCEVTGDLGNPGPVMDQVWQGIRGADVVIAEITGGNSNVFYEIGMAHALGKEVILLSQEKAAPFDIRSNRLTRYDPLNLPALQVELEAAFRGVSPRYPFEGIEPRF